MSRAQLSWIFQTCAGKLTEIVSCLKRVLQFNLTFSPFPDNKPSYGPSYINFYEGYHKNIFVGKLLISIDTEKINEKYNPKLAKQNIPIQLNEFDYWTTEIFQIHLVLINLDFIANESSHMRIYLNCEDAFSNEIDIEVIEYEEKFVQRKFVRFGSNVRPLLSMKLKLPDNRLKQQVENSIRKVIAMMVSDFTLNLGFDF